MRNLFLERSYVFVSLLISLTAYTQNSPTLTNSAKSKNPFPVKYISQVDQNLNLKVITLAPVYDNVNAAYSKPIQNLLISLLKNDKDWGYSEHPQLSQKIFIENYDANPASVLNTLQQSKAQGMLTAFITKGPQGLTAKLKLFTQDGGLLLLEESFEDLTTFEVVRVQSEFVKLYQGLKNKLPYRGYILSRRGTDVTLNVGQQNGVRNGQEVLLAQILKIQRHPKTKVLISSEKAIIGKVLISKSEPYLSFGRIIYEKEPGVVDAGAKVLPTDNINYPVAILNENGEIVGDQLFDTHHYTQKVIEGLPQNELGEWVPKDSPQFGKAILQGGLTQYEESSRFLTGNTVQAKNTFSPTINLLGQFWLTKNWFMEGEMKHAVFRSENDLTGSSPGSLSYWYSFYHLSGGYNFLFSDDFWGPKLSVQLGYATYQTHVTDSTPTAFTSTETDGVNLKITGAFHFNPNLPYEIGAYVNWLLKTNFSEKPVSSGSASTRVNSFSFYGSYIVSPSLRYRLDLSFGQIQADFNGVGSRSSAVGSTTIGVNSQTFGIEYFF